MLIARNGTDWYRITHSLRVIIETTNAAILEGATRDEKQPSRSDGRFCGTQDLIRALRLLSNEWFILVTGLNHGVYGNRWPELLAIASGMLQCTIMNPFRVVMVYRATFY
jgi:hypothetical protein